MKKIVLTIAFDKDKIVSLEHTTDLGSDKIENHLMIIGALENIKQKHLDKLKTLFQSTRSLNLDRSDKKNDKDL